MQSDAIFSLISQLFVEQDQKTYEELTSYTTWQDFLSSEPLDILLTQALRVPLTFQKHQDFCRKHFVGGLPCSAMPVESLYVHANGMHGTHATVTSQLQRTTYLNSSAQYMKDLISSMRLVLPQQFNAYPDHLSLECDMYALLCGSGLDNEAHTFLHERFIWIEGYKQYLHELKNENATFFCNLLQALMQTIACN